MIRHYGEAYEIKLNANKIVSKNLRVFDISTWKNNDQKCGIIDGDDDIVNETKQNLIHEFKKNK